MTTVRRLAPLMLCLPLLVSLHGCQNFQQTMSDIDWQDRGNAGPAALDQGELSVQVADVLAATPSTMNQQIKVAQLQAGSVRLSGFVLSGSAARDAVRLAYAVPGVDNVVDTISVR